MTNNRRYDLSNRLIHFFRKLDLDDGSAPDIPEDWGIGNIDESTVYSPLFLLRCAIRHGRLWATWARRRGIRTIYGPRPAICLTDMPSAAFLETSIARASKKQKISTYALTFPKPQMFRLGARPVVYGLSASATGIPPGKDGGPRIIPDRLLPPQEQYRYVTYAPTGGRWNVDWTHEREWRWPLADETAVREFENTLMQEGMVTEVREIPGLDLYESKLRQMGVIVNSTEEANMILHDVLVLVDRNCIAAESFEYVLVANDIPEPEEVRGPDEEADAIADASLDLSKYLDVVDEAVYDQFAGVIAHVNDEFATVEPGDAGGCWLWLTNNVDSSTRALVNSGRVVVTNQSIKCIASY